MNELKKQLTEHFEIDEINPYVRYVAKIYNLHEEHHVPRRVLYDYSLICVLDGELNFSYQGEEISVKTGDVHFMPPYIPHKEYIKAGGFCEYYVVHFDLLYSQQRKNSSILEMYLANCKIGVAEQEVDKKYVTQERLKGIKKLAPVLLHVQNTQGVLDVLHKMNERYAHIKLETVVSDEIVLKSYMLKLLAKLLEEGDRDNKKYYTRYVNKFIDYANEHYQEEFELLKIATEYGFTPNYFRKIFKSVTQKTPHEYLKLVRIEQACRLLEGTLYSVQEIAYQVGFDDAFYFSKVFKKMMGVSPKQYREYCSKNIESKVDGRLEKMKNGKETER